MDVVASSKLIDLIDTYKDAHGVPDTVLARRIGISRQNLNQWRSRGFRAMPHADNLHAVADVIGQPYIHVLDAALHDSGYLSDD